MRIPYTTMIDRPGLYLTRAGSQVRIDSIVPGSSFPCKGRIARVDSIGRVSASIPGPHAAFIRMRSPGDRKPPGFNNAETVIYRKG